MRITSLLTQAQKEALSVMDEAGLRAIVRAEERRERNCLKSTPEQMAHAAQARILLDIRKELLK